MLPRKVDRLLAQLLMRLLQRALDLCGRERAQQPVHHLRLGCQR